jgi:hypothetical protein
MSGTRLAQAPQSSAQRHTSRPQHGVTLVGLFVVIVVFGVPVAIAAPRSAGRVRGGATSTQNGTKTAANAAFHATGRPALVLALRPAPEPSTTALASGRRCLVSLSHRGAGVLPSGRPR